MRLSEEQLNLFFKNKFIKVNKNSIDNQHLVKTYNEEKKEKRKNKYNNKKIKDYGYTFDSLGEHKRFQYLMLLEKSNKISNLEFHNKKNNIVLIDDPKVEYEPDFCYIENGLFVVEDFKGVQTKEFILKKKMIISKLIKKELDFVYRITKIKNNDFIIVEEYKKKDN